jgi:hypothetical protein
MLHNLMKLARFNLEPAMLLMMSLMPFAVGCTGAPQVIGADAEVPSPSLAGKSDRVIFTDVPEDFPVTQDIAIIFPLHTDDRIKPSDRTSTGEPLLSEEWMNTVNAAYRNTVVEDGVDMENVYEDWRVVSVRFAPCGPLGHHFGQSPDQLCWPQVRIVWQPVMKDFMLFEHRPYYADDRAIHALYHVMPLPEVVDPELSRGMLLSAREVLADGHTTNTIREADLARFVEIRNAAIERWTELVLSLRTEGRAPGADFNWRMELNSNDEERVARFTNALRAVFAEAAVPNNLFEMTAFSLPEGRQPALLDLWTFLAFDGENGRITQRDVVIHSPADGTIVGNAGLDETVGMNIPDPELVEDARTSEFSEELTSLAIFAREDNDLLGQAINDPKQTLVPNTSCASCHRFNKLRFDFHNLSHLEDRELTIAPRVVNDVTHELEWLRSALGR